MESPECSRNHSFCSLSFVSQAQQALKFGTVNSQEIFMLMPEKATAEQTLQDINKKYEDEFVKIIGASPHCLGQQFFFSCQILIKRIGRYDSRDDTCSSYAGGSRFPISYREFPGNGVSGYSKTTRSSFRSYSTEVDGCH